MFRKVSPRVDFPELERSILQYWKENDIVGRALREPDDGERFIFYEGPPTANGRPHIGHVLPRAMKDLIPRHRAMSGYHVPRKAGWDTHGLPVELEVEKKLGISGKADIEAYGIEQFIDQCKESVFTYKREWEELTERIGFWLDLDTAYVTYHEGYIESVWWALRRIWDRGLLYRGHKVVPYCARCGCALSSHELAQGYAEVEDPSVFVRFPLVDREGVSLAVWTTTPWTLISNVAAAVSADDTYAEISVPGSDERLIMARALVDSVGDPDAQVIREFPGSDLVGLKYHPPYSFIPLDRPAHYVVAADFVTLEDGTGIVHIAPAFGEDDMRVGMAHDLPVLQPVDAQGLFVDEVSTFSGKFVKDADPEIIQDLEQRGLLLRSVTIKHTYPMCWRCDTPLLYYARSAWFIRVTEVKEQLLKNNQSINWHPEHMRDGRFGNFLDNVVDWCLSRERYWGTPLPIWVCGEGHEHCVGSVAELKQMATHLPARLELHKPYIDDVVLKCPECGGDMRRIPEVIDCWFDSGAMPFAQYHYPFENKELFERNYPADFICEAIDQTRGWFYSLLAISTLLFDQPAYKNVLVTEHGLDDTGAKMSKHKGNVLDPWSVIDTLGADALRWFLYISSPPWYPKRFSTSTIKELHGQTLGTLWNVYVFFMLYASIDEYDPERHVPDPADHTVLDRWIISRLETTTDQVGRGLDGYDITGSARALAEFVDDLSNWYVRRSRRRFWAAGMEPDKIAAFSVLHRALIVTARLFAPFTPFLPEELHRNLVDGRDGQISVHLSPFPDADLKAVDRELERNMTLLREYVRLGRAARNRVNIRIRQPLPVITLVGEDAPAVEGLGDILLDELNVKRIEFAASPDDVSSCQLKLRFEVAGARYGRLTPRLAAALSELKGETAAAAARTLAETGSVHLDVDGGIDLPAEAVNIERVVPDHLVLEGTDDRMAVLDTRISSELQLEGLARELVNRIERMRKDAGFDVQDEITTYYRGDGNIGAAADRHRSYILTETLSRDLVSVEALPNDPDIVCRELTIDGIDLWLGLRRH